MAKMTRGRGKGLRNVFTVTPEPGDIVEVLWADGSVRVFNPSDPDITPAVGFYPPHYSKAVVRYENDNLGIQTVEFRRMEDK